MSIFRYTVKLSNRDPVYGKTRALKECGDDKEEALRWADENGRNLGLNKDLVYVEEAEYVSESNLQKGISLYRRPIWSAAFHGYSEEKSEALGEKISAAQERKSGCTAGKEMVSKRMDNCYGL